MLSSDCLKLKYNFKHKQILLLFIIASINMPSQECILERAGLMFCLCASLNDIGHVNDRSVRVWWGGGGQVGGVFGTEQWSTGQHGSTATAR